MSELITPEEFINDKEFVKALKTINASLADLLKTFDALSTSVKGYYTEVNKGAKSNADLVKNQNLVNKSTKELTDAEKELERLRKDTAKTIAKQNSLKSEEYKANVKAREELKKQKAAIHDVDGAEAKRRANIGKYKEDIVKAYVAIQGVIVGAKAAYQGLSHIIESTEGLGDKVRITVSGLQAGMDYFAKSLSTMDFSNFFTNLAKVYRAGKEYQEAMENIEDANWAYRIKQADIGLAILQKKANARGEQDKEKKKILIDEILGLEQQLEDDRVKIAESGLTAVLNKTSELNNVSNEQIIKFIAKNKDFMDTINRQGKSDLFTFAANQINYLNSRVHDYEAYLGDLKEGTKEYVEVKEKLDTTKKDLADLELKKSLLKLNKAEIDSIVKYYEELKGAQGQTEDRMQRFLTMRVRLEQELAQDIVKENKDALTQKEKDELIYAKQREMFVKGEQAMLAESDKEEEQRGIESAKRMAEIDKAYYDARIKADEETQKRLDASYIRDREAFLREQEAKKQAIEETKMLQIDSANAVFDLGQAFISREGSELDAKRDKDLKAAGDDAKKKEKIESEYQKKMAAIKRKAAVVDKIQALFNIGINTAIGVTKATAQLGAFGIPVVSWIKILGALQAAAVLAAPIPKFFKGVKDFKGGVATVGEKGMELVETPKGSFLTPDKATTMLLPEHSTVHTHEKTIEKLNGMDSSKVNELIKVQKETQKAIANQVHHSTHVTEDGLLLVTRRGNSYQKHIDTYYRK